MSKLALSISLIGSLLIATAVAPPAAGFAILYVDDDQASPQTADGTTWQKAYKDLRLAIQKATTQPATYPEIRVAKGRYPTTQSASRTESFHLVLGVAIRGGYRGLSDLSNPDARDIHVNETILTGDLAGNDPLDSDNAYTVVDCRRLNGTATDNSAQLEGFTITGGSDSAPDPFDPPTGYGAGIYCPGSNRPTIQNCRIVGNKLTDPLLNNYGAGMYVGPTAQPVIADCEFRENRGKSGAGLYIDTPNGVMRIERCKFIRNYATGVGGGAFTQNFSQSTRVEFVNCAFRNNVAQGESNNTLTGVGGAINHSAGWLNLYDCLFDNNTAIRRGGAVYVYQFNNAVQIINCTLSRNASIFQPTGGVMIEGGSATITNTILWDNRGTGTDVLAKQIATDGGSYSLAHTIVQGCTSCGGSNSDDDPQFRNAAAGNFRLALGSPAINSGDNAATTGASIALDLDGRTRILTSVVDRGPYEYDGTLTADCNSNGYEDSADISAGRSRDCNTNGVPDECDIAAGTGRDCDGDGLLNLCETPPLVDCNDNCVADATDISTGGSTDCNGNSVPDDCEFIRPLVVSSNADFDRGVLINVNHDTADQLQRNTAANTRPLPYVWVGCSGRNSIVRIASDHPPASQLTSAPILGEYLTAPALHVNAAASSIEVVNADPSRTTVDLDGLVWVGNRQDNSGDVGSVVKIGLVVGGTRVNAVGAANPFGQYLKPPFQYCTCEDRNGDGLIRTSMGPGNVLAWDNVDGLDDDGGVAGAEDECIIRYARVAGMGVRLVAIDKNNDVWVGGYDNRLHERLDGFSGVLESGTQFDPRPQIGHAGGYGGLVDCNSVLWAASATSGFGDLELMRVSVPPGGSPGAPMFIGGTAPSYGLGIDFNGDVWMTNGSLRDSSDSAFSVYRVTSSPIARYPTTQEGELARGVCVTPGDNDVWVANSGAATHSLTRLLAQSGYQRAYIDLGTDGNEPTGVAVDAAHKVWATCRQSHTAKRVNPVTSSVDLTVDLGALAYPYNYSDMTGLVALQTSATGTWSIVHDGAAPDVQWACVSWNQGQPPDARLAVGVRAANARASLPAVPYAAASNGGSLSGVVGRFIEVRVRFEGSCPGTAFSSPILYDLAVRPNASCVKGNCNHDPLNRVNGDDIQPFVNALMSQTTCLFDICPADMNNDGAVTTADIPCFRTKLLSGSSACDGISPCGALTSEPQVADCNTNGIADDNDIADATSADCNNNFIPDECDLASADPDQNGQVSSDLNANGVPDECEPDCNTNGVPDDKDIADYVSADLNANGMPDECEPDCNSNSVPDAWDISQHESADCNTNGVPDECETDCNGNGVPDDCDLDSSDPDGNQQTSPDCNGNGLPDECDFDLPFLPSYDCNTNGVPDECDIASAYSADCNTNGIPDKCDIASSYSNDENTNDIPDECEEQGQSMMAGGSGGESADSAAGPDSADSDSDTGLFDNPAWEVFFTWQFEQQAALRAMTPEERFYVTLDKLYDLGLPPAIPWAQIRSGP